MSSLPSDITVPGRPEVQEVSPGVYAYVQPDGTWWINNTGFLLGPQGVISIDTCSTQRRTRAYLRAIESVTPAPVRAVVNTHHHGDHTFGNCLLPGAADTRPPSHPHRGHSLSGRQLTFRSGMARLGRAGARPAVRHLHR